MTSAAQLQISCSRFEIPRRLTGHEARNLRARIQLALEDGQRHVVVDCEAWTEFDLGILSALIQSALLCREHGAAFVVANLSSELRSDVRALQLEARLGL